MSLSPLISSLVRENSFKPLEAHWGEAESSYETSDVQCVRQKTTFKPLSSATCTYSSVKLPLLMIYTSRIIVSP